ncbi:hypothetical protein FJR38_12965 [Anabaena sp. UHCC 0253]|uniref:hypothetical protein n=1 Tax=Anabaena sp. UHCC 0253 TaxID=2590019 RepID=UPI0014485F9B|nr:hypothetical protein [Anabaena sp. UHCC 0253]MTJ53485.1 hypothetical protein [Anabaena sp. UHCC 0253]
MLTPQPGEIWEVSRLVQSPLKFSDEEQQTFYSFLAQNFLAGNSPPRYVMIVKEPEPLMDTNDQWLIVSVMLLSEEIDFLSDVDLLIPSQISGFKQDFLAETWHIVPALTCNLARRVGNRLSRHIYDYLLTVRDYYYGLVDELLIISPIQELGIICGDLSSANSLKIQGFHKAEQDWSDILTVPVAACETYLKSINFTNSLLNEAVQLEQDLKFDN